MTPTTLDAYNLFHEGAIALARVEHNGIRIDVDYLEKTINDSAERIRSLQNDLRQDDIYHTWRRFFGSKANLGSREQLAQVLFDEMKHPYPHERTATGRYRADEDVLIGVELPFVQKFLAVEKLKKLKSTYLENLRREVVNGFIHPFYNLHTVETYRGSADRPNIQNQIARHLEFAAMLRRAYIPRKPSWVFSEIDYGALEFRIAACFWKDPKMVEYASDPTKDIHRDMAAKCYSLKQSQVTKDSRYCGKNGFVFPRIYGSDYINIARNLWNMIDEKRLTLPDGTSMRKHLEGKGIDRLGTLDRNCEPESGTFEKHIKGVQDWFERAFPVLAVSKRKWLDDYKQRGWFPLMTGFRVSGFHTNNFLFNCPVQGPGFHCLLWSLIRIQKEFRKRKMKSRIVAQIHDCVLVDGPETEVQEVLTICKQIMTQDIRKAWDWIITPMEVEADVTPPGGSWYEKKPWIESNGIWVPKERKSA